MDSESLRTFLAIHRTGSFSGAAEALHRSQPAISRRIALLENELGVPLFERAAGCVPACPGRSRLSSSARWRARI